MGKKKGLLLDNFSLPLFTMDKPMYIMAHGFTNSCPWSSIVMPLPMNIIDGSGVLLWYSFFRVFLCGTCGHLWVSLVVMRDPVVMWVNDRGTLVTIGNWPS
jgi:hypothetical protein